MFTNVHGGLKMKTSHIVLALSLLFLAAGVQNTNAAVKDFSDTISVFKESSQVQPFFKDSYAYAVFPTVGKGAAVIGGTYGKGQMYRNGEVTGEVKLFKLSIGPQIGGNAYSQIIFFKDKQAYDKFTQGRFTFDANASVIAVKANAQAAAGGIATYAAANTGGTGVYNAEYEDGIAVAVRGKGGFLAEVSVGGQNYSFKPIEAAQ